MIKINVVLGNSNWGNYVKNPKKFIQKKINSINRKSKKFKNKKLIFTLNLSGSTEIKKLNKKFRKKNKTTDVLSFPFYEGRDLQKIFKKDKEIYLGDVIINIDKIKKDILNFENNFNKLWIHGFFHLLGYRHKRIKEFKLMKKNEEKYLSYIN